MQHLNYSIRYSVVPIHSSLLTRMLYSLVRTTFIYNNTKYSVPFSLVVTKPHLCLLCRRTAT